MATNVTLEGSGYPLWITLFAGRDEICGHVFSRLEVIRRIESAERFLLHVSLH